MNDSGQFVRLPIEAAEKQLWRLVAREKDEAHREDLVAVFRDVRLARTRLDSTLNPEWVGSLERHEAMVGMTAETLVWMARLIGLCNRKDLVPSTEGSADQHVSRAARVIETLTMAQKTIKDAQETLLAWGNADAGTAVDQAVPIQAGPAIGIFEVDEGLSTKTLDPEISEA